MVLSHEDVSQLELASWGRSRSSCSSNMVSSLLKLPMQGGSYWSFPRKTAGDTGLHLGWGGRKQGVEGGSEHACPYLEVT